jgi:glycine/D-amino acid oxidase-like deaminating enzyme
VEKTDIGAGTSSATTKYVHGGLRYLEQRQFGVVRESLRERTVLGLAAPHLVQPRRFLLPAWRWSTPPTPLLAAGPGGLRGAGLRQEPRRAAGAAHPAVRWAGRAQVLRRVPWLDPDGLQGAFAYYDSLNVHPERLLLQLLASAVAEGAAVVNHAAVTGLASTAARWSAVDVRDELGGSTARVRATAVVNCAGPWVGEVLAGLPSSPVRVRPVQGRAPAHRAARRRGLGLRPGPRRAALRRLAVAGRVLHRPDRHRRRRRRRRHRRHRGRRPDDPGHRQQRQHPAAERRRRPLGDRRGPAAGRAGRRRQLPLLAQGRARRPRPRRPAGAVVGHRRQVDDRPGDRRDRRRALADRPAVAPPAVRLAPGALADGFADWPASYDEVVHARPEVDLPGPCASTWPGSTARAPGACSTWSRRTRGSAGRCRAGPAGSTSPRRSCTA